MQPTDLNALPKDVLEFYNKATRNSKLDIAIVDGLPDAADGCFHNGMIYLNAKKVNDIETVKTVFAHETFHAMAKTNGYDSMINLAIDYNKAVYRAEGLEVTREDLIEMMRRDYADASGGQMQLSDEDAIAELGAQFMSDAVTDEGMIDRLVSEKPSFARQIWQMLKDWVHSFGKKEKLSAQEAELKAITERAQRLYERSFRQLQRKGLDKADTTSYSIGKTTNGDNVVLIEDDIFAGKPNDVKAHKYIADYIKSHIGEVYTLIESGQKVYLGKDLPGEFTRSKATQYLANSRKNLLNAKYQSTSNIGELIEIATDRRWEKAKHDKHKTDAKYGFYKYKTRFALPNGEVYTADLVIRNDANGKKYLYDQISIKKDGSTIASTHNGSARPANRSAFDVATIFDDTTIPQNQRKGNSNIRYSLNDNAERTARQKAILEKIQAEKAQAKAQGKELSKAYTNTIMNSKLFSDAEKEIELSGEDAMRDRVSEQQSLVRAAQRLEADYDGTVSDLENRSGWNGEDLDAAMFVLQNKATESQNNSDYSSTRNWLKAIYERAAEGGRFIQAFAKYSRNTAEGIMLDAQRNVERAEEEHKGKFMGKTVKSKTLKKVEQEAQKAQEALQQAEQEALQGAETALKKIVARGGKHPNDITPTLKKAQNGKMEQQEQDSAAESLANKVDYGVNGKEKADSVDAAMVRELYEVVKELDIIPEKEQAKRNPVETLQAAISNKSRYTEVWMKAQQMLEQKYAGNEVALEALKGFFKKGIIPTYSKGTVNKAVMQTAKDLNIDLREIIKQSKVDKDAAQKELTDYIVDQTGAKEADAGMLASYVQNEYEKILKKNTEARLKQLFPEYARPQLKKAGQKNAFDKLMELINLGAYENQAIVDIIKEKNKLPVLTNEDIANIQKYVAQANEYQKYSREWKVNMSKAHQIAADKQSITMGEKVVQFARLQMLSNPRTMGRNVVGNVPLNLTEVPSDVVGSVVDWLTHKKTGSQRSVTWNPHLITEAKGMGRGVKETVLDIRDHVDTYRMGEDTVTQYEMPRGRVFKNNDGLFGKLSDGINLMDNYVKYGLMFGDRPFFEGHYDKRMAQLKDLGYDVTAPETKAKAYAYAVEMVYQNQSDMAKGASGIRNNLNNIGLAFGIPRLGNFAVPFIQTPANIADKVTDYYPPTALAKIVLQLGTSKNKPFDSELFARRIGRAVTGTGIVALSYALSAAGILTGSDDDDKDKRQAMRAAGWRPYSIKIGDTYYDYSFAQPIGMLLAMGADMYQAGLNVEEMDSVIAQGLAIGKASLEGGMNCFFNMSFFQNFTDLTGGYGDTAENITGSFLNYPTQFANAALGAAGKSIDPYQREVYDPNPTQQAINRFIAKVPYASKSLPEKLDVYGNPVMQNQGRDAVARTIENVLNPTTVSQTQSQPVNDELLRLSKRTGDNAAFFTMPTKKVDFGEGNVVQMSSKERQEYIRDGNGYSAKNVEKLMQSSYYKGLSDSDKIDAINDVKKIGNYKAKKQLAAAHNISFSDDTMENKLKLLKECGNDYAKYLKVGNDFNGDRLENKLEKMNACDKLKMDYAAYDNLTATLSDLHDSTDSNGKTIKGKSRKDKVLATLNEQYKSGKITQEQMWYLWVNSYSPSKRDKDYPRWHWEDCPYQWIVDDKKAKKEAVKEEAKNRA